MKTAEERRNTKMMYISKAFEENIGATMHYRALKEIFGASYIFTIDLRLSDAHRDENYIAYGKYKTKKDRILQWLQENTMFLNNSTIREICSIINQRKIKTVFIEDSIFGNLVKAIKEKCSDTVVISFYHDVKADLYQQWMRNNKTLVNRLELSVGIKQEKINQQYADINMVFNQRDVDVYKKYYGSLPEAILPLPAPVPLIEDKDKIALAGDKKKILFVGKNYYPNLVGLDWFVEKVLPGLKDNLEIQIVGRGLEILRGKYTDKRINVIGGVESLDDYYKDADIVMAPLFDGGGMKSKTVEALSYGKTFVGTKESLFGFWEELNDTVKQHRVFQIDTPEEWISVINTLAESEIAKFDQEVFDIFVEKFSYDACKSKLEQILLQGEMK